MQQTFFDIPQPAPALPVGVGFQPRHTSRQAAERVAGKAPSIRARVMDAYRAGAWLTADECAEACGEPGKMLSFRPRVCDCVTNGLLVDTGLVRPSACGQDNAIVWRIATRAELEAALAMARKELEWGDGLVQAKAAAKVKAIEGELAR